MNCKRFPWQKEKKAIQELGGEERQGRERGWKRELKCIMYTYQLHTRNVNITYYTNVLINLNLKKEIFG